jgi:LPPG:FO 2-phospho-L-lactate transferase
MGLVISPLTVAEYYADLLDGFVLDEQDAAVSEELALPVLVTQTIMTDLESKQRLAAEVLGFAAQLRRTPATPSPLQPADLPRLS